MYFPGLHGLRFFAALAVVLAHVELLKSDNGFPSRADNMVVYELGRIAVTFFFVLSGFLITFLLLEEKRNAGSISISKFYVRRVLRIWPLYYLVVFLAFAVIPHVAPMNFGGDHRGEVLPLFLALLPQVALTLYAPVPYAEPLWSIGVEEQFYLLWPLVVARVKRLMPIVTFIAVAGVVLKAGALTYASHRGESLAFWNDFIDFFYFSRFECMAVGAACAWLVFERKSRILNVLFRKSVQVLVLGATAFAVFTTLGKPILQYGVHSLLFGVIILNVAANERSLLKLRAPAFIVLGNISYAMYLLHEFVIVAMMRLIGGDFTGVASNIALYVSSVIVTVIVAGLAYRFYELPFLRLKDRVAVVKSGAVLASS